MSKKVNLNLEIISDCSTLHLFRSSHQRCSMKKDVLRNFAKFTGKHLSESPFLNKIARLGPQPAALKKRLWHRCFPVNFAKFLRTSFFIEHLHWLLLPYQQFLIPNFGFSAVIILFSRIFRNWCKLDFGT